MPSARADSHGDLRLATDGRAAPEGAQWDAPGTGVFLDTPAGTLTYDLGIVRSVSSFVLQADANDSYKIFGALEDNPSAYKLLVEVEAVVNVGHGLRTRPVRIEPTAVRYVRIGEPLGDNAYSISEFQAYCTAAEPVPAQAAGRRRARGQGGRGALVRVLLVRQRRERALRDGAGAGRGAAAGVGDSPRQAGAVAALPPPARRPAGVHRRGVVLLLLQLRVLALPRTTSTSGTRSTTTSGRSTSKSCRTTGCTNASRSPTRRSPACAAASSCAR